MMVPKPKKRIKEQKYNSLQGGRKKDKKPIAPWRENILSSHQSTPSKADRAEFPAKVVKQAKERSGGICEYCKKRPCTTTHHVKGRGGRNGRGVLSNAYRCCGLCHLEIEGSEEKKQEIIREYTLLYGEMFWFDEKDWELHEQKQSKERQAEQELKQRYERLEPITNLLTLASGRKLKAKEMRLLDGMNESQMKVFVHLINDVISTSKESTFSDRFED